MTDSDDSLLANLPTWARQIIESKLAERRESKVREAQARRDQANVRWQALLAVLEADLGSDVTSCIDRHLPDWLEASPGHVRHDAEIVLPGLKPIWCSYHWTAAQRWERIPGFAIGSHEDGDSLSDAPNLETALLLAYDMATDDHIPF